MQHYNTQGLIAQLSGKDKAFVTRVSNLQEKKYGNTDIFDVFVEYDSVEIWFGENHLAFYFDGNRIMDTYGNGQGHKYHKSLESIAIALHDKYNN